MMQVSEASPRFDAIGKEQTPFIGFRNWEQVSDKPLDDDIDALARLKQYFPRKVIIASIMGQTEDEWVSLAKMCQAAGVDMIECNFSCPHMSDGSLGADVGTNPGLVASYVRAVRSVTKLPILAKMTPNITNMEPPAIAAIEAGADGIAAINTIKSLTGILASQFAYADFLIDGKSAVSGYSGKAVKPIAQRFVHDLKKHPRMSEVPVSGIGGIETWQDAAEFIALGCGNVQVTTAVMQYGYRIIEDLKSGLSIFLAEQGMASVNDLIGVALPHLIPAGELDRESAVYPIVDGKKCVGCGRCHVSCRDAGHQAMEIADGKPRLNGAKCVGCGLCMLVCPMGALSKSKRVKK
jgi:dihydropyrimidine dehydrogenase (NAD+) subunit PreA